MDKSNLEKLYLKERLSSKVIAQQSGVSENKINYWLKKHGILKRSISEAIYFKKNPNGHPFSYSKPVTKEDYLLFGLGIGLFWGEGNKRNKMAVRLGNTDPDLIKVFIKFLGKFYQIDKNKLRYGLQIFSDVEPNEAKSYWIKQLSIKDGQLFKITVTPSRVPGTYRHRNLYGVLTVHFSNIFLKKEFDNLIEKFRTM